MTADAIDIRPLAPNDAQAYKQLRLQAIADSPAAVWPTAEEEDARTLEEIGTRIAMNANQVVYGGFASGRLVGVAGLRREALIQVAHKATVWGVFVAPEYRRAGLARQVLERVAQHARDLGILQLCLTVNTENERARQLYHGAGFVSFGVEPRAMRVGERFYDEELMLLRLDGASPGRPNAFP